MRIALDLTCLTPDRVTGIGVYAEHLAKALQPLCEKKNSSLEAWIPLRKYSKRQNLVRRSNLPINIYNEFNRWWAPPDLVHGLDFKIPRHGSFRKVVTIHDLVEFEEEFANNPFMAEARNKMRKMLLENRPDHIICDSDFTLNKFKQHFPDVKIPTTRVYLGVDHKPGPQRDLERSLQNPYLLFVGTLEKRKNPAALLKAFEIIKNRNPSKLELVLAGGSGLGSQDILKSVGTHPFKSSIHVKNSLSQKELLSLYQHTEAFVLPTIYEGFGFPVLEAMGMGAPVITSEFGAVHEISGSAALFVDPRNPSEIADAVELLARDQSLRQDLIIRGYDQASKFTWKKTAEETYAVYERTLRA